MTPDQEAAQSLVKRALDAERQSEAELLIDAAKTLDLSIKANELKSQWLEQWLEQNKNRKGTLT